MGGHRGNRADQGTCPRPFTLPFHTELWAALTTRLRTNRKIPTGRYFYRATPLKPWALPGGVTPSSLECKDYTPSHSLRPFKSWLCTPLWLLPPSLSPQATPFLLPGRTWASGPLAFSSNSQGSAQEPFPPIPPGAQGSAQDLPVS